VPEEIYKYFLNLSDLQKDQFRMLLPLYSAWNSKINVISRKDMENFYIHHVLHSLAVARIISFNPGTTLLDVGTGGGFPGIPLAIMFPDSNFFLMDSIEKKIKVVKEVSRELQLNNINTLRIRAEDHKEKYDFVISRAVTAFPDFVKITGKNIISGGTNTLKNGIIYLKGGDLNEELGVYLKHVRVFEIKEFFAEPFFETKKIVYLAK
jgi:16S rRNA (guanine527-N7)-methyltransferase